MLKYFVTLQQNEDVVFVLIELRYMFVSTFTSTFVSSQTNINWVLMSSTFVINEKNWLGNFSVSFSP